MRIGLVTPLGVGPEINPGCAMITAGIRWLLRHAIPGVEFVELELHRAWSENERASAAACDLLALCGNPRFDTGDHEWMYAGVIGQMRATGLPLVDLFAGACVPLEEESPVERLLSSDRNQALLDELEGFRGIATRDDLARRVLRDAGVRAVRLPCSSWWAAREFGVAARQPDEQTRRVLVPIRGVDGDLLARLAEGREIVAVTGADADWCAEQGLVATLVSDPHVLLSVLAACEEVISFRLHAGIPAASLDARVVLAAIDSRAQAGEAFGIPWGDHRQPLPKPAWPKDPINPIPALREVLHASL